MGYRQPQYETATRQHPLLGTLKWIQPTSPTLHQARYFDGMQEMARIADEMRWPWPLFSPNLFDWRLHG